jgi:hypothetical protein
VPLYAKFALLKSATHCSASIAFKTALIEASLNAELNHDLGYAPGADKPEPLTNHCNGSIGQGGARQTSMRVA